MKNGSQELILLKKKNLTVNLAYLIKPQFRICIDSPLTKFQLLNNEYRYWSQIFSKRVKLIFSSKRLPPLQNDNFSRCVV